MKISTLSKSKNFATHQSNNPARVFTTNAFSMQMPYDEVVPDSRLIEDRSIYADKRVLCLDSGSVHHFDETAELIFTDTNPDRIEMDLTNPHAPFYRIKMTKDGDNTAFARAAPGMAISMFGRYETVGQIAPIDGERIPTLQGFRGYGHMQCPMFDLNWARKKTGYPCKTVDMPRTVVIADAHIDKTMYVNTLIDVYLHFDKNGTDINTHIMPNDSRMLNIQFQIDRGRSINPEAHAGGMSGAKFFMVATVAGIRWSIGYKHETHNGNSFPFLSFTPEDGSRVTRVEVERVVKWVIENWADIEDQCDIFGFDLFDCTIDRLLQSFTCGPHVLNEVLGEADGAVSYRALDIQVSKSSSPGISNPPVPNPLDPPKKKEKFADLHTVTSVSYGNGKVTIAYLDAAGSPHVTTANMA